MICSIESIHDGMATLVGDDGSILCIPAETLPAGAHSGDLLQQQPDGSFLSQPQTAARRAEKALSLFRKLKRPVAD